MKKFSRENILTKESLKKGMVVASVQGRDRFRTFVIVDTDNNNSTAPAIIADGVLHRTAAGKHKNPAHLRLLSDEIIDIQEPCDGGIDVQIAEICAKHRFSAWIEEKTLDK